MVSPILTRKLTGMNWMDGSMMRAQWLVSKPTTEHPKNLHNVSKWCSKSMVSPTRRWKEINRYKLDRWKHDAGLEPMVQWSKSGTKSKSPGQITNIPKIFTMRPSHAQGQKPHLQKAWFLQILTIRRWGKNSALWTGWMEAWWMHLCLNICRSWFRWEYGWFHWPCSNSPSLATF